MPPLSPHPEEIRRLGETQIDNSTNLLSQTWAVWAKQEPCLSLFELISLTVHLQLLSFFNLTDCKCICAYLCFVYVFPCALKDVTRLPEDAHSHLYEDVRDVGLHQDILPSPLSSALPLFDQRLPHQRNEWKSPTHPQVCKPQPRMRAPTCFIIHICRYHDSKYVVYKGRWYPVWKCNWDVICLSAGYWESEGVHGCSTTEERFWSTLWTAWRIGLEREDQSKQIC